MSWNRTYSHTVALGADRFAAAVVFNQADITVSSLCWIVRTYDAALASPIHTPLTPLDLSAISAFKMMNLYGWQVSLLRWIGKDLEAFFPGHCAKAREGDISTSERARLLLGVASNGTLLRVVPT
jgi:hypothetical protein